MSRASFRSWWVAAVGWCRSSISTSSSWKFVAARWRASWSHPLVSRTPPMSRNRQVVAVACFIASSSIDRFIAATFPTDLEPARRQGGVLVLRRHDRAKPPHLADFSRQRPRHDGLATPVGRVGEHPPLALGWPRQVRVLGPQDPHLTWPPEREGWVLAYPAYRRREPVVSRALPREIREVRRLGPVMPSEDKDAALSPRRFEVSGESGSDEPIDGRRGDEASNCNHLPVSGHRRCPAHQRMG